MEYSLMPIVSRKWRVHLFANVILVFLVATPLLSFAKGPFFTELSEAELSEIRGMYVSPSRVQYFGLSMTTQWGAPSRSIHQVGMSVAMEVTEGVPHLEVSRSGTLGAEVASNQVKDADINPALEQIGGVVQGIQVAGIDNTIHNKLSVNVIESTPVDRSGEVGAFVPGRQVYQTDNGITTDFSISDKKLGYSITTEKGVVTQALAHNMTSSTNQLLQSINIFGSGQQIVNSIRLDVAFDNTSQLRTNSTYFGIRSIMGR